MSSERTLLVVEAAHIPPYGKDGLHELSNGLLLRSDLHKLFDRLSLAVSQARRIAFNHFLGPNMKRARSVLSIS
jgi:putative restriction endonuclease